MQVLPLALIPFMSIRSATEMASSVLSSPPEQFAMSSEEARRAICEVAHRTTVHWWPEAPKIHAEQMFGKTFRSCALVSNAGTLLLNKHGLEIDAAELTVRFNFGPTLGFEEIAGSRTDVRIMNDISSKEILSHHANSDPGDSEYTLNSSETYLWTAAGNWRDYVLDVTRA